MKENRVIITNYGYTKILLESSLTHGFSFDEFQKKVEGKKQDISGDTAIIFIYKDGNLASELAKIIRMMPHLNRYDRVIMTCDTYLIPILDIILHLYRNSMTYWDHFGRLPSNTLFDDAEVSTFRSGKQGLTPAELTVLALIFDGKKPRDIAHELTISEKTVSQHKINILNKLGFHNINEMIVYINTAAPQKHTY